MNDQRLLLEAARAMASSTSEAEVARVAAEYLIALLGAAQAGWVTWVDAEPVITAAAAAAEGGEPSRIACADASAHRHAIVSEGTLYVPIVDGATVCGVIFVRHAPGAAPPSLADVATIEAVGSLLVVSLRNVSMFASLETLVAQEMTRVVEREASMQLVLDSMTEGLLVCDISGTIGPIRSRAVSVWFGEPAPNAKLGAYLTDPVARVWLEMGFDALVEGFFPFDLIVHQMPKLVVRGDRSYRLGFHPVLVNDEPAEVVVTVRDVTAELAQAHADQINGEIPVIVAILLRDRLGFQAFVDEVSSLFARLGVSETLSESQRIVHTIKGNAFMYGFTLVGNACHAFEDCVAESPDHLNAANVARLEGLWREAIERISMFLVEDDADSMRLSSGDYDGLLAGITEGIDHAELLSLVRRWREPKVAAVLGPYASAARQIATKLDKDVEITIADAGLRLPREELRSFCATLVHVIRNALDHGLEPADERRTAGKPAVGRLVLQARRENDEFVLSIEDDGRGIDWTRVAERARAAGLSATTEGELVDALFTDGVSTSEEVSTLSGRGVGLGATRARCLELGGRLSVRSERGTGTRFEFRFPG